MHINFIGSEILLKDKVTNKINYQKQLDVVIDDIICSEKIPSLLLHSCCAPCSSYVIYYLAKYFNITIFYYNPNIRPLSEYIKRLEEQKRFVNQLNFKNNVKFIAGTYDDVNFYKNYVGLESEPEGKKRCYICYKLRLLKTVQLAMKGNYDYFTTTLTVSPHKNSDVINKVGKQLEDIYNVKYLYSDFKKKDGYKKSVELSKKYNLYRQNYCGCTYSKK